MDFACHDVTIACRNDACQTIIIIYIAKLLNSIPIYFFQHQHRSLENDGANIKMKIILLCLLLNLYLLEYSTLVKNIYRTEMGTFSCYCLCLVFPFTFKIEIITLVATQKRWKRRQNAKQRMINDEHQQLDTGNDESLPYLWCRSALQCVCVLHVMIESKINLTFCKIEYCKIKISKLFH